MPNYQVWKEEVFFEKFCLNFLYWNALLNTNIDDAATFAGLKVIAKGKKEIHIFHSHFQEKKKCSNITLQKFEIWDQKSVNTYDIAKLIPICTYVDYGNITRPQRVGWTWAEWARAVYAMWNLWGRSYYSKMNHISIICI